jgi:hypothetical protein
MGPLRLGPVAWSLIMRIREKPRYDRAEDMFIYHARVNILDAEIKKRQFAWSGYTFLGELSPEEAKLSDLRMHETVLAFGHPLS